MKRALTAAAFSWKLLVAGMKKHTRIQSVKTGRQPTRGYLSSRNSPTDFHSQSSLLHGHDDLRTPMMRSDRTSVFSREIRRTIRPLAHRNQEYGEWVRSVVQCQNGGAGQICAPSCSVRLLNEEHEVGMPVPVAIAQVLLL